MGAVHPTYRTPYLAIVVQGIWSSVLVLTGTYGVIVSRVVAVVYETTDVTRIVRTTRNPSAITSAIPRSSERSRRKPRISISIGAKRPAPHPHVRDRPNGSAVRSGLAGLRTADPAAKASI